MNEYAKKPLSLDCKELYGFDVTLTFFLLIHKEIGWLNMKMFTLKLHKSSGN